MSVFKHPTAEVLSSRIGDGSRIWQFCVVLPEARIGMDCNICANCFIENDVVVGDGVTLKCGVYLWDGITLGNGVFVGPNATFTNDLYPRSKRYPDSFERTVVQDGASIGAGAVLKAGITVGRHALVGAGSVVTRDVGPHELWYGNPARFKGYVCSCGEKLDDSLRCASCETDFSAELGKKE